MPITQQDVLSAFPNLTPQNRDDGEIAEALSQGRTRTISPTLVGIGPVLRTLGPAAGAGFLDALETAAQTNNVIKWGLQMVLSGTLDIGDPLTVAEINGFTASSLLTQEQAAALIALAVVPDPVTRADVAAALAGWEG